MKWRATLIIVGFFTLYAGLIHITGQRLVPAAATEEKPAHRAEPQSRTVLQSPQPKPTLVEGTAAYKYLCFLPKGYNREIKFWPTIVFLHGAASDESLDKLKRFGPIKFGLAHDDFPFIVIAPATSREWSISRLDTFLDRVQRRFRVDLGRLYLTGCSMGGHATWKMAAAYPSRFAAIAPVAGAGNPGDARGKLQHVPAWVFHGQKDSVVPVERGLTMIQALKQAGGEVKSTIYPDRGHDVWEPAYSNQELYQWFLQHRRGAARPGPTHAPR